ncbi:MAG: FosX/FosE/FosI family fosfomycin resistance hydrolase [Pseudomonadota bacterium]
MSAGLSHITLVASDLDRMQHVLEVVLEARCIYDSGAQNYSLSPERFFLVGDVWVAVMLGEALPERSYNHVAFKIDETEFDARLQRIKALGLEIKPPRERVDGEGRSIYFYSPENHLIELHTGTLQERLARYASGQEAMP